MLMLEDAMQFQGIIFGPAGRASTEHSARGICVEQRPAQRDDGATKRRAEFIYIVTTRTYVENTSTRKQSHNRCIKVRGTAHG